jgi:uncharacterized protein (TIGR02246 family)
VRYSLVVALCCVVPAAAAAQQPSQDEVAIRSVVVAFVTALASGDSAAALALLHADAVIFEGGSWESLDDYRKGHLRADMRFLQAMKQETLRKVVTISSDLALVTKEFTTVGTLRERAVDSIGVETMVLVRTAGGWKIRHIHWSSRPRQRRPQ